MKGMTSLFKARYLRVAGLTLAALAIGIAAIAVTASAAGVSFGSRPTAAKQSSDAPLEAIDASSTSAVCSNFMKHFAVEISKTQAQINTAFQKAIADTLADEVKSGQITQAQADSIQKKLANQTPCSLPAVHSPGPSKKTISSYMQQYVAAAASALGLSEAELKKDLAAGQSLSQVAAVKHVTEADFRSKLISSLKPKLDQAVTGKSLTAAQEKSILDRLQTGELPLWNAKKPKPATATPTASPKAA
jgi:ribosome-binding protein aMBF1 (putative translation factor)